VVRMTEFAYVITIFGAMLFGFVLAHKWGGR
jgi:hypothetical protein